MAENVTHRLTPEGYTGESIMARVFDFADGLQIIIRYEDWGDSVTIDRDEAANFRDILNDALPCPKQVEMERILREVLAHDAKHATSKHHRPLEQGLLNAIGSVLSGEES